ncbi:MAG: GNAT family N-acetyltransferase [Planctomycetes bacterium]|nr:GNAT family N-acetyltransferase [Planctomycetota bacterium]
MENKLIVREIKDGDVAALAETFSVWQKKWELFAAYLNMHIKDERFVLVATLSTKAIGYCTIKWESYYEHFRHKNIPEIVDLNVIGEHQGLGIAKKLISYAEAVIKEKHLNVIGISCVPSDDYASPCQIYMRAGFKADGFGITDYDGEIHLIKTLAL